MSEKAPEKKLEKGLEKESKKTSEKKPKKAHEKESEKETKKKPEKKPEKALVKELDKPPEKVLKKTKEKKLEKKPEKAPEKSPEKSPEKKLKKASEKEPEKASKKAQEKKSEKAPEKEPDKKPEEEEKSSDSSDTAESEKSEEEDPNLPEECLLQRLALSDNDKVNMALYAPPKRKVKPRTAFEDDIEHRTGIKLREPPTIVFYFGGDMQNFRDEMGSSPEDEFVRDRYCLEATVLALRGRFEHSAIVAVQPAMMLHRLYAIYSNFYDITDKTGSPCYTTNSEPLHYLVHMIISVFEQTGTFDPFARIALVGFSKGVCVLNQLLISLHHAAPLPLPGTAKFRWAITELYLLDGGHCGQSGAWLNDPDIIGSLANYAATAGVYPLPVRVGVTAFQIEFKRRTKVAPWIAEEEETFCHLVERFAEDRVIDDLGLEAVGGPKKGEKVKLLDLKRLYCRAGKSAPKTNETEYYLRMHFSIIDKLVAGEL
ncbi:hypothetical protein TYRP_004978 [Tyrophagus putrescentiae]|nr:hypothetical protein TYRP_004978 [Tyrophagus putrescentiae]